MRLDRSAPRPTCELADDFEVVVGFLGLFDPQFFFLSISEPPSALAAQVALPPWIVAAALLVRLVIVAPDPFDIPSRRPLASFRSRRLLDHPAVGQRPDHVGVGDALAAAGEAHTAVVAAPPLSVRVLVNV